MYSVSSEFSTQAQFEVTSSNGSYLRSSFTSQHAGKCNGASNSFEDGIFSNRCSGEEHVPDGINQIKEKLLKCIKKLFSSLASEIQGNKNAENASEPESCDGTSQSSCDSCGKKSITDNLLSLIMMLLSLISELFISDQTDESGDSSDLSQETSEDSEDYGKTTDTGSDDTSTRQASVTISVAVAGTE
jgi:hypothetical protein